MDTTPADNTTQKPEPQATTRRAFLDGAGRKALYITPVVLSLAAQPAAASGFQCGSQLKHTVGSPCDDTGNAKDCCPTDSSGAALDCVDDSMGGMWCQNI